MAYKELGRVQNERFKKNLNYFRELNQNVSMQVKALIENIYNMILETLKRAFNEEQFDSINIQINDKFVKPVDKKAIFTFGTGEKTLTQAIYDGIINATNNNTRNTSSTGF